MASTNIPVSYETAVEDGAAVQALTLAGFVVLLYDHILTLDLEVDLIWKAPPGFVSVVFLLNRYLVPLVLAVDTYELSGVAANSVTFCKVWTVLQSYLTIASFMSIHAVMAIRVYALHNGGHYVRWFLWISGAVYLASSTTIITVVQIPVIETLQPLHHQCVGTIPPFLWLAWLPTVIFESLLFILILVALLEQSDSRSFGTLTLILYRDGMFYFVAVTFCSTFSLLVWALAPPTLNGLARYFALAIVNVTASRMILNLKSYAASRKRSVFIGSIAIEHRSPLPFIPRSPTPQPSLPYEGSHSSPMSSSDLEMHAIAREYQQLGTKLR